MNTFANRISGQEAWTWRQSAVAQAKGAQIDAAEVDWLLQGLCQVDGLSLRLGTLAKQPEVAARVSLTELGQLWEKRVRDRVPIQHLVGSTPWRKFTLQVSPSVLIPRPETELLIDLVKTTLHQSPESAEQPGTWVDLGTGSGAIALGLADALPQATILAVDVSVAALAIAQQNAVDNGLADRIEFLLGSWFTPLGRWQGQLAGMVSNPPYIPSAMVPTLQPEVAHHEPHLALDGGEDGLASVDHLIKVAPEFLQPGGFWGIELMMGQAPIVVERLTATGQYDNIQVCKDLSGIERFVLAQKISRHL